MEKAHSLIYELYFAHLNLNCVQDLFDPSPLFGWKLVGSE